MKTKEKHSERIMVTLTITQARKIKRNADELGLGLSSYLRMLILQGMGGSK